MCYVHNQWYDISCATLYIYIYIYIYIYTRTVTCVILIFRREVAENCALLFYYAASSGNFIPAFSVSRNVGLEDRTDRLS